ncbi:GNAT family N-acetyltransferase [Actinocrinis puniceicyclus]|uniref:GNAT family N-acetyltransferase n=1 Tax=Actinocrinis puniceicyclus TaxID=977794 RepID=A0A8J7WH56_9ACTN|nr:GNAT family N-acetyltransferase [Actinocrinis puniceicyclus]MBS2962051.1 GNAT family N-acetyltransferase [Actinocrinis puniceicyclus]
MTGLDSTPTPRLYHRAADLPDVAPLLAGEVLYAKPDWLAYCEASAGGRIRHVVLEDAAGRAVAMATYRIVPDENVLSLYDLSSLLPAPPAGDAPGSAGSNAAKEPLRAAKSLVFPNAVGAVSGAHCVLLTDSGADPATRSALRRALVRAVAQHAAQEGCDTVGFLYLRDRDSAQDVAEALGDACAAPFPVAAQMQLAGGWPDFEGYLATLPSPRRNKIRRERKQFLEAGILTRAVPGTVALDEDTARLQLALRRRYGAGGTTASILADYEHLHASVEERVLVFRCEREGRLVGVSLALLDGDHLHVRLAGFDYGALAADFAYFNAVYYEPVRWGIEHGITRYSFGTGTYGAKLARGCRPSLLWGAVLWPAELREAAAAATAERGAALLTSLGLAPASDPPAGADDRIQGAHR